MTTTTTAAIAGDAVNAAASCRDDDDGPTHASAPAADATNDSVLTGEDNDEGAGDEPVDDADQARFVAFVLHSLAGESFSLD